MAPMPDGMPLTRALKSPLLDSGQMLSHCGNLLVNISGGPRLTLAHVQAVMEELGRFVKDRTQILFGATEWTRDSATGLRSP